MADPQPKGDKKVVMIVSGDCDIKAKTPNLEIIKKKV